MGLNLEQAEAFHLEDFSEATRKTTGKGCLSRSGRTDKKNDTVQRKDAPVYLGPDGEIQDRLREQLRFLRLIDDDRIPHRGKLWVWQIPDFVDALRQFVHSLAHLGDM
jgi:hypothetical protein